MSSVFEIVLTDVKGYFY